MGTYFRFDLLGQHEEKAARLEAVRQGAQAGWRAFSEAAWRRVWCRREKASTRQTHHQNPRGASPPAQDSTAPSSLAVGSSWQTPSEHPSHPHRPPGAVEGILTQPNPQAATGFRLLDEVQDDKDHSRGLGSHQAQVPTLGQGLSLSRTTAGAGRHHPCRLAWKDSQGHKVFPLSTKGQG